MFVQEQTNAAVTIITLVWDNKNRKLRSERPFIEIERSRVNPSLIYILSRKFRIRKHDKNQTRAYEAQNNEGQLRREPQKERERERGRRGERALVDFFAAETACQGFQSPQRSIIRDGPCAGEAFFSSWNVRDFLEWISFTNSCFHL